jgi:hypothetical protein
MKNSLLIPLDNGMAPRRTVSAAQVSLRALDSDTSEGVET